MIRLLLRLVAAITPAPVQDDDGDLIVDDDGDVVVGE